MPTRAKRTMSAQTRYRTLVANTGAIYAASQDGRTVLLQKGLDDIVGGIQPTNADQWNLVKTDSERLLKVWFSKEKDHDPAAGEVVSQLLDLLKELATPPIPSIVIADKITHVQDYPTVRRPVVEARPVPVPVPVVEARPVPVPVPVVEARPVPVVEAKSAVKEVIIEEEEEEEEEVEEEEEEVEEEEVEVEEEEEVEVEEEEVEEEEIEVEEEEGMEVEQVQVRGRTYWLDVNTKKLYSNAEGDEVGDEVGSMINGKPVFLSK
jgi:hypothetical protein